jgi:signal transduction histidine kinase
MTRSAVLLSVTACVVGAVAAVAAAPASHLPKANTREAVVAYVQDAAKIVQKGGPSCAAFATPAWTGGDYYIFVAGPDEKTVCHPRADLVGKSMGDIVNSEGDKVGDKIYKVGTAGKGWVEYLWARPGKTTEEPKSTYVMGVNGPDHKHYLVGSGAWDLKK